MIRKLEPFTINEPEHKTRKGVSRKLLKGMLKKAIQRRSRPFAVLTYWKYAPRVKMAVALLDDFFDHSGSPLIPEFF